MKKIKYEVVKKHCVVEGTTFNGNLNECQKWLKSNCWYDKSTDSYYSNDPKDVDEYGKPFTYHLTKVISLKLPFYDIENGNFKTISVDVHFDEEQ